MLLGACGTPPPAAAPSPTPAPIDACRLMTVDDADPGGKLGLMLVRAPTELSVGQDYAKCSYGTGDLPIMVVSLEVRRLPSAAAALRQQKGSAGVLDSLSGVEAEPVEGVGDSAMWAGGRLNQLHAVEGDLRFIVTIEVGPEGDRAERARAIALAAIERQLAPAPAPEPSPS